MDTIRIKVCGLTNLEDARAAQDAGADLLGFIFYPPSPRAITPEKASEVLNCLGQRTALAVGVFVNESIDEIVRVMALCGLDAVQLHGEEPPAMLGLAGADSPLGGRAYKALRPRSLQEAEQAAQQYALPKSEKLPAFLIDAYHPLLRGGSGETGDWQMAADLAQRYPLMLAGGLTPQNAARAVEQVRPWGLDVASGVELSPGRKDHAAVHEFIRAARSVK